MKKTMLRNYARLIAVTGAGIKKGQEVWITADLDQPEFVKMVVEECYKAGAKNVRVDWEYQPLAKTSVRYRSLKVLSTIENWQLEKLKHRAATLPATIYLESSDPDGLKGINQKKMAKAQQATYPIIKPISDEMENKYQWCIAAVPGAAWAKKVFPGEIKSRAVEKLWEAILKVSRADGEDPVQAWKEHNEDFAARCDYLNSLGIDTLEYKDPNGTDLKVGLIEDGLFLGGGEYTLGGDFFNPNIPTEEIFTSPKRGRAEGIVYASKPLS
ncbi:MAG: aminopeptidase, partial [Oscillospiraceae bacterium]|nr:aminopeptidase [Oscillospiraceae bacterium]